MGNLFTQDDDLPDEIAQAGDGALPPADPVDPTKPAPDDDTPDEAADEVEGDDHAA